MHYEPFDWNHWMAVLALYPRVANMTYALMVREGFVFC
jgi:hypothetical protein